MPAKLTIIRHQPDASETLKFILTWDNVIADDKDYVEKAATRYRKEILKPALDFVNPRIHTLGGKLFTMEELRKYNFPADRFTKFFFIPPKKKNKKRKKKKAGTGASESAAQEAENQPAPTAQPVNVEPVAGVHLKPSRPTAALLQMVADGKLSLKIPPGVTLDEKQEEWTLTELDELRKKGSTLKEMVEGLQFLQLDIQENNKISQSHSSDRLELACNSLISTVWKALRAKVELNVLSLAEFTKDLNTRTKPGETDPYIDALIVVLSNEGLENPLKVVYRAKPPERDKIFAFILKQLKSMSNAPIKQASLQRTDGKLISLTIRHKSDIEFG